MSGSRCKKLRDKFFAETGSYPKRSRPRVGSEWRRLKSAWKRRKQA